MTHRRTRFSPQMIRVQALSFACVVTLAGSAFAETRPRVPSPTRAKWSAHWNQGKAELTSYTLQQARYGELHDGRAVLVFVTEPFSRKKQVKLDNPGGAGGDAVEVLKLNHTRKFNTGIYPYSTMRSVFTPTNGEKTLKVTTTVQEWCGHVFMQLNRRGDSYGGPAFSYFESEGDRKVEVPAGTLLEDDVWTTIRINPQALPVGEVSMLPSSLFLRLLHVPVRSFRAVTSLAVKDGQWTYTVRYTDLPRTLTIQFDDAFPYQITGWTEQTPSGFGAGRRPLKTVAKRKASIMTDYWRLNRPKDRALREQLGLPKDN